MILSHLSGRIRKAFRNKAQDCEQRETPLLLRHKKIWPNSVANGALSSRNRFAMKPEPPINREKGAFEEALDSRSLASDLGAARNS